MESDRRSGVLRRLKAIMYPVPLKEDWSGTGYRSPGRQKNEGQGRRR